MGLLWRQHRGRWRLAEAILLLSLCLKLWVELALWPRHWIRILGDSLTGIRPFSWKAWVGHQVIHRL